MWCCKCCGEEVFNVQEVQDIDTREKITLTNNSIFLCPNCLSISDDLEELAAEE